MSKGNEHTFQDEPKSLRSAGERSERLARADEPHVVELNDFVRRIRTKEHPREVPYFDPDDGGVGAYCLFLFEAPGPQAVRSGFVSRNNPDESAKNFFLLNVEAGLPRRLTVSWNIVPWYIGSGQRIRAATAKDIAQGLPYLQELLSILPNLKVLVLVGRKAQRVEHLVPQLLPGVDVVEMLHPSPLVLNTKRDNRGKILATLRKVAGMLGAGVQQLTDA